jgi:ATP-dependent exoDNAse (exonuclease V) beta subunit
MSDSNKPLNIISASAGSGKTYVLVKEYLKLLLSEESNSSNFRSILAMTFTNKAALEMKERVIKALDELSSPERSTTKSNELLQELIKESKLTEEQIRNKFRETLSEILHHYEDFSVMTMDKFNLKLIKAFSRDLDLPVDFEISFNGDDILSAVVDELMAKLGNPEYADLNNLILRYARAKLDEGEKWNIRAALLNFIKIIESERNKQGLEHLMKMNFTTEEFERLVDRIRSIERVFKQLCIQIQNEIPSLVPKDLPGGETTYKSLFKYSDRMAFPLKELFTDSFLKKMNREDKKTFPERLEKALFDLYHFWLREYQTYNVLFEFKKNYFNMALLKYVFEELIIYRKTEKIIRIAEFNELIASLIQQEEAPFIYERLGSRYRNFLLDEFQDTSWLQWTNLTPLVHNSLANGDLNLIVGDAKQSIYRFKNGVAEQFVQLPEIYNPFNDPKTEERSRFFAQMGKKYRLDNNWRSSPVIVDFNNTFFQHVRDHMSETGKAFYEDLIQNAQSMLRGSIEIVSEMTEISEEELIELISNQIELCVEKGFKYSDICVLGVRNKECNKWAIGLTKKGYQVVSADSLLINGDPVVQLLVAYFGLRHSPHGKSSQRQFAAAYFKFRSSPELDYSDYLNFGNNQLQFDFSRFEKEHFSHMEELNLFCNYETLYDLVEKFMALIKESELDNSYAHHFADVVYDYETIHGPDLGGFLEFYDKHKKDFAVQVPESDTAITIMTIHKSKGLEFPVVLIPNLSMKMDSNKEFLINKEDMVIYKKPGMNEVIPEVAEIYSEESDQTLIDNINLLYVGMTRPKERLVVFNHFDKKGFGDFFHRCLSEMNLGTGEGNCISYTTPFETRNVQAATESGAHFIPRRVNESFWVPEIVLKDDEQLEEILVSEKQQFGNQFHLLISKTDASDQLDRNASELLLEGKMSHKRSEEIIASVKRILEDERFIALHKGAHTILKEQAILLADGSIYRPDRILLFDDHTTIIDFKTGERNPSKDQQQLRNYISTLIEMGHKKTNGVLIYTENSLFDHVAL